MLANQAAIRLGMASPEHADREQAREAIDALAGVVELLAPLAAARGAGGAAARSRAAAHGLRAVGRGAAPPPAAEEPAPEDEGPGEERPPIWTPGGEV